MISNLIQISWLIMDNVLKYYDSEDIFQFKQDVEFTIKSFSKLHSKSRECEEIQQLFEELLEEHFGDYFDDHAEEDASKPKKRSRPSESPERDDLSPKHKRPVGRPPKAPKSDGDEDAANPTSASMDSTQLVSFDLTRAGFAVFPLMIMTVLKVALKSIVKAIAKEDIDEIFMHPVDSK